MSTRAINYLRLSVTDQCNYRCRYCMPEDAAARPARREILSLEDLEEIARASVACGISKIRLTGGEPLIRPGIVPLCRALRNIPGLTELAMTTNASLLPSLAQPLREAGLDRLNISLDTLQAKKFTEMTRRGQLQQVQAGLHAAWEAGFSNIKINVVLIRGWNDDEIEDFVALTQHTPYSVRFIELMPLGPSATWQGYCSAELVLQRVPELRYVAMDGVAQLYKIPGYCGTVGLIRPISQTFCSACNRIRVTADGTLKPCLHAEYEIPLRGLHGAALQQAIEEGIRAKPERHHLIWRHASETTRQMNEIGG